MNCQFKKLISSPLCYLPSVIKGSMTGNRKATMEARNPRLSDLVLTPTHRLSLGKTPNTSVTLSERFRGQRILLILNYYTVYLSNFSRWAIPRRTTRNIIKGGGGGTHTHTHTHKQIIVPWQGLLRCLDMALMWPSHLVNKTTKNVNTSIRPDLLYHSHPPTGEDENCKSPFLWQGAPIPKTEPSWPF